MTYHDNIRKFILLVCLLPLFSCLMAQVRPAQLKEGPMPFISAIQFLAQDLMAQVIKDRGILLLAGTSVVIDPFADADTNEVLRVSRRVEEIMIEEITQHFKTIDLTKMTLDNLRGADYVMNGTIRLDVFKPDHQPYGKMYYQVSASAINLKTGKVVGRSDVWISDRNLDYLPTQIYEDSPMYLKDPPSEGSVEIATGPVGAPANRAYYDALETMAILMEAEMAYEIGDYTTALTLLNTVAGRSDGQLMKTYAGLYSVWRRLGRMDMAEDAFGNLLSISVEKNHTLTVKFLFDVNSVEFWKDPELKRQYEIWIQQIGTYFHDSPYCLRIVGHCSRTGTETYNDNLSFARAYRIQQLLRPYFPDIQERSEAMGKGFKETIKGIGTDDERDAIDRRVEFMLIDCKEGYQQNF